MTSGTIVTAGFQRKARWVTTGWVGCQCDERDEVIRGCKGDRIWLSEGGLKVIAIFILEDGLLGVEEKKREKEEL